MKLSLSDVISYNKGLGPEGGNNYWRRYTVPHFIYVGAAAAVLAGAMAALVLFAVSDGAPSALRLVLELAPVMLAALLAWFTVGRAWISVLMAGALVISAAVMSRGLSLPLWAEIAVPSALAVSLIIAVFLLRGVLPGKARAIGAAAAAVLIAALVFAYRVPELGAAVSGGGLVGEIICRIVNGAF